MQTAVDCPLCLAQQADQQDNQQTGDPREHRLADSVRHDLLTTARRSPRQARVADRDDLCTTVGILGGGTAGYLTAIALRRKLPQLAVSLIESSTVPVIGVGEATTPLMPQFLHVDLGLDIHEFFREVEPTLKLGIHFDWGPSETGFNYPFGPVRVLEPLLYDADLLQCSPQSTLMAAGSVPIYRSRVAPSAKAWRSELDVDTAYHLDNPRFVAYLRRKARELGVETIDAKIKDVQLADDGETVTGLLDNQGRRFAFDLFVDCTGFRSLLLGASLESPFCAYDKSLFADRALVATVPQGEDIAPFTRATTANAGWWWSTPQRQEDHRGYVFCSAFASPEEAEHELRRISPELEKPRLLSFRTGRHEHFMKGNVVALGNAYGFVEPLESTALHMLIRQIGMLLGTFPQFQHRDRSLCEDSRRNDGIATLLNRRVGAYWDYLSWFLALHYRFNRRLDTPFWRHCRAETDVSAHAELIESYHQRGPLSYQPAVCDSFQVPDPLWGAEGIDVILAGQQVAARLPQPAVSRAEWSQRTRLYRDVTSRAAPQAQALRALSGEPELLEHWVAALRGFGPAFSIKP